MIHKVAQQPYICVVSETFKRWFAAILMKKKLFWGVNRWEKDALVVDSADYDSGSKFVSLNSL